MIVFGGPHLPLLAVDAHCQCQKYVPSPAWLKSLPSCRSHSEDRAAFAWLQPKCGL
ncbi:hypothetical protein FIBSPDRAFT_872099, partial [Athelia psychrophila]